MNETIENLKTRRSIRKFKDEQITDEELKPFLKREHTPQPQGACSHRKLL